MSEHFESIFDRDTPEIVLRVSVEGKDIRFNAHPDNSAVFIHDEDYDYFDHIWLHGSQLKTPIIMWRDESGDFRIGEELIRQGWIPIYREIPSATDEQAWFEYQDKILHREIRRLERGERPWEE